MNGTVGVQCRAYRLFSYPWPPGGALVMMSDGLKSHWQSGKYHGLLESPGRLSVRSSHSSGGPHAVSARLEVLRAEHRA
jgi:hypothetical protein